MKAFLVANPKGGSGKSTLATNLAGYFANKGCEVMLGDIDRQPALGQRVGAAEDFPLHEGDRRRHVGLDEAGSDGVDRGRTVGQRGGFSPHQPHDPGLGGRIVGLPLVPGDPRRGGDADDSGALPQTTGAIGEQHLVHRDLCAQIHVKDGPPLRFVEIGQRRPCLVQEQFSGRR